MKLRMLMLSGLVLSGMAFTSCGGPSEEEAQKEIDAMFEEFDKEMDQMMEDANAEMDEMQEEAEAEMDEMMDEASDHVHDGAEAMHDAAEEHM